MSHAIQKGDIEGALKSAKVLLDSLEDLMNLFKETSMQYAASIDPRTLNKIDKLLERLLNLENEEMGLVSKTDELNGRVSARVYKMMDNIFEKFFDEQKERFATILANISEIEAAIQDNQLLNALTLKLSPSTLLASPVLLKNISLIKERFLYLSEMLEGWDIEESLTVSKDTLRLLEGLHLKTLGLEKVGNANVVTNNLSHSVILNEMIVNDLEAFVNSVRGYGIVNLTPEETALLKGYAEVQSQIKKGTLLLQGMIEEIGKESPIFGNEIHGNMVNASNLMSYAETKLDQKNIPGAVVDERESLYYLSETRHSLEELKKITTQGLIRGGMPMPFFVSGSRSRYNGYGQYNASMEDVNIPPEDAYKVPKEFREDILEGMKDNFPRRYEALNRDYFKRLLQ